MGRAKVVFVGPHGWRAGWRFLLFFTMALVSAQALDAVIKLAGGYQQKAGEWSAGGRRIDAALTFVAVVVGMAVMARLERRSFAAYGLPLRARSELRLTEGALWGFTAATFVLLAIRLSGGAIFHGVASTPGLAGGLLRWAATLLSLLFGAAHLSKPDESAMDIAAIVCFGLFLCLTRQRTGSLWFAIGFHAMWNYAAMALYAAPASVFTFVALGAMGALFARRSMPEGTTAS